MSGKPAQRTARASAKSLAAAAPESPADTDLRLIVEETGEPGQHAYAVVDRRTGAVVSRFGEREMQRRLELGRYAAGDGVSVKA